jgi:excisionase family DNA binding protein
MSANDFSESRYVSLSYAAEILGISERTVRRMIATRVVKGYKIGPRLVRVDLREIEGLPKVIISIGGSNE